MSSAGALRTEGNEKFRSKQYFDAYRLYQSAAEKCSEKDKTQMANIYICLSKTEFILEKTEASIISATKAIELDPNNYRGYLSRANAYFETLSWDKAYNDLIRAQELEPSDNFIKQRIELARTNLPSGYEPPQSADLDPKPEPAPVQTREIQLDFQEQPQVQTREITIGHNYQKSPQKSDLSPSRYQRASPKKSDPYYDTQSQKSPQSQKSTQNQNQRSYQDTLKPHSIPDPTPMSPSHLNSSDSVPSGKYTSAGNIELMRNMMNNRRPPASDVLEMIESVEKILSKEPNVVKLNMRSITFHIVGDTHGQYQDVIKLFEEQGYPSTKNPYLFNGDFVDRGSMGVEIVIALLAWKLFEPTCIYFNRGNHETRAMNAMYGFEKECTTKYNRTVYEAFAELFNTLPIGHVINDQILIVHGGLSDQTMTIEKVNAANRFQQPPDQGLINDILWADPMDQPGLAPSPRGVTKTFGPDVTQKVLSLNKLTYLVRSHQVQENGYLVQHNRKCITVFSAPNYIGSMFNKGAICDFTFSYDGKISNGPSFITFAAQPIPRLYPPMKFSPFGAMF